MSDTMVAILMLPVLILLVLLLECSRVGCTWLIKRHREARVKSAPGQVRALDSRMER